MIPGALSRRAAVTLAALVLAACLGDPAGPRGLLVSANLVADSLYAGHPGEALLDTVRLAVTTVDGEPVAGAAVTWIVGGAGAQVLAADAITDAGGRATAQWLLGVRASETQVLDIVVATLAHDERVRFTAQATPHVIARLHPRPGGDTTLRLGDTLRLAVEAEDPFGNRFPAPAPVWASADTTVVRVDTTGLTFAGPRRGSSRVTVTSGDSTTAMDLSVVQYVAQLVADPDTLRFTALADTADLPMRVVDDRGLEVADTTPIVAVDDAAIAALVPGPRVVSSASGRTQLRAALGVATLAVPIVVSQVPDSIAASLTSATPIVPLPFDTLAPLACAAWDRNGYQIPDPRLDVQAAQGGVAAATSCDSARVRRSGFDTIRVAGPTDTVALPIVIAVRPIVTTPVPVVVDSLPAGRGVWAPSLRRNSAGALELYFAGYTLVADSNGLGPSDLYRYASTDGGATYRYDGIALTHDSVPCSLQGSGIENIEIVSRADSAGWRMFFSAGSFGCYGWQVFSAVSTDERTWVKEPGIRLSNGGQPPPAPRNTPPWPAGEGMVTELLPSGEWRMLAATYENVMPVIHAFAITEWRSPDQLTWTYTGPVITPQDMPPEARRTVASPAIRQIAPGLWRMLFHGDDVNVPSGRGRIWSALSTDKQAWQIEGTVVDIPGSSFFYVALVDDRIVTVLTTLSIRANVLYTATVQMP